MALPPSFRFKPTQQELITLFLKRKAMGLPLTCNRIIDRNLYGENRAPWDVFSNNDPWEIVGDSEVDVLKKEIYVFTKLEKNSRGLIRRGAGCGKWHGKSRQKEIKNRKKEIIGFKKSFKFIVTRNPTQDKLNVNPTQDEINKKHGHWIMHEYTLEGSSLEGVDNTDYAVCRISWELPALHDQEQNSEANLPWPEMTREEGLRYIEEYYPR